MTLRSVTIVLKNGGQADVRPVFRRGVWAVHASIGNESPLDLGPPPSWTVTHVPSGSAASKFWTRAQAIQVARELYSRFPRWRSNASLASPDKKLKGPQSMSRILLRARA